MLNMRRIREQTDEVKAGLARRGEDPSVIDRLVAWDSERRALLQESEALKAERNRTSKSIGASKDKEALTALREQMRAVGQRIKSLDSDVAEIEAAHHGHSVGSSQRSPQQRACRDYRRREPCARNVGKPAAIRFRTASALGHRRGAGHPGLP